ncbi:MAG TPA: molecular chaperone DnaK [Myxococcales bacterium]
MDQEPVIGIDLGTTNSVVATVQNGQASVIKNRSGANLTPSVVAMAVNGKRLVGSIARRQAVTNAENTAFAVKRLIGRKWSSPQVQEALKVLSYKLVGGEHDDVKVVLGDKDYSPQEISAMVLGELKADAEAYFGCAVKQAVITVPAYFNDGQRQATKDAGKIAGLEVLRIINEPTSAALAYGFGKQVDGKVAVFDLGGGTFDISLLQISSGVFEVLGSGGDTFLGGEDFDFAIIKKLADDFHQEHGPDLRKERMALQRLKEAAEKAKCELSTTAEAHINLPFIYTPTSGASAMHLNETLTRDDLEELTRHLVSRCIERTKATLDEAGVKKEEIGEVILVGGMTRMPSVARAVREYFGREPCKGVHPDEVVALGAAIQASALVEEHSNVVLLDVTPHSLGVALVHGYARTLIPKNTTVPTSATEMFSTSADFQTSVKIVVLQGESEIATKNEPLGEFLLSGLRPAPRGEVEIAVTFEISADGIVSVSAKDTTTGKRQSITVTASGGLTQDELVRIIDEQRDYLLEAQVDEEVRKKRAEVQEQISQVEALLPKIKELVAAKTLGAEVVNKVEKVLRSARGAVDGRELSSLSTAGDDLGKTLSGLGAVVNRLGS